MKKVYTTLNTLSAAWTILDELGIGNMLVGKQVAVEPAVLMNQLLKEKRLQEFLGVITHEGEAECGEMTAGEAVETITAFFLSMRDDLKGLPGLQLEVGAKVVELPKPKSKG